jgi:hypothetical protein
MPLKLNVGLSRKIGDSDYGSRGGSVNLELELDSGLVNDSARLQERIRQLFGLVRTSLTEELNGAGNGQNGARRSAGTQNGSTRGNGNGNGRAGGRGGSRPASCACTTPSGTTTFPTYRFPTIGPCFRRRTRSPTGLRRTSRSWS